MEMPPAASAPGTMGTWEAPERHGPPQRPPLRAAVPGPPPGPGKAPGAPSRRDPPPPHRAFPAALPLFVPAWLRFRAHAGRGWARLRQRAWGTARRGTSRMSRHVATGCGATWRDRARHAAGRAPGGAGAGAGPAALRGQRAMPGWPVATVTGGPVTPGGCEADEPRCRRPPPRDGRTGTEERPARDPQPCLVPGPASPWCSRAEPPSQHPGVLPHSRNPPPGPVLPPPRAAAPLPARRHREGPGGTGRDRVGLPVPSAAARRAQSWDPPADRHPPAETPVRPGAPVPVPVTVPLGPPPTP